MPESQIKVQLNPDVTPAGSDLSIVNAARRSFNTRSEWDFKLSHWETGPTRGYLEGQGYKEYDESTSGTVYYRLKDKDKRLLEFLARGMTADDFENTVNEIVGTVDDVSFEEEKLKELLWQWRNTPTHDTPFNHTFISFEVQAPIFVRAQLVKHEYLIMSEFSRRYITGDIQFYEPDVWRKAAENKKQGSSDESVEGYVSLFDFEVLEEDVSSNNQDCIDLYNNMVTYGVAPEQARMVLPQSTMTEWTWSGTLGAFAKMCTLRLHPEAQYEARLVAEQVYGYLKEYYPVGAKALVEGV